MPGLRERFRRPRGSHSSGLVFRSPAANSTRFPFGIRPLSLGLVFRVPHQNSAETRNEFRALSLELVFRQIPGQPVQRRTYPRKVAFIAHPARSLEGPGGYEQMLRDRKAEYEIVRVGGFTALVHDLRAL